MMKLINSKNWSLTVGERRGWTPARWTPEQAVQALAGVVVFFKGKTLYSHGGASLHLGVQMGTSKH